LNNENSKKFYKVEVFNLSSKTLPDEIIEFLSMSKTNAVVGSSQGSNKYCEVEKLSTHFQSHARINGLDEESVIKINSNFCQLK
jgi:hypothetical protein